MSIERIQLPPDRRALLAARVDRARRRLGADPAADAAAGRIPRHAGDEPAPLSHAQARLWFMDRLERDDPAYYIFKTVAFRGPLDPAALERAFNEIVRRHSLLRTRFVDGPDGPLQIVDPPGAHPVRLDPIDLATLTDADRRREVAARAEAEFTRTFDLAEGRLLRARLIRVGEDRHLLFLLIHHIAADGWSVGVLLRELAVLHEAFSHGRPSPLPELPIQYADFAQWQRRWLDETGALDGQLEWWRAHLAAAAPLELPLDRPRPSRAVTRGASERILLPVELAEQLEALARHEDATLFIVLLAAFQALLSRLARQDDVIVGTPVAGRTRGELEPLIGFFVNMLPLRADCSGDPTFRELLARVRDSSMESFARQDLPFERLVQALDPVRDTSRHPLFQVLFALQNAAAATAAPDEPPAPANGHLRIEFIPPPRQHTRFDIEVHVARGPRALQVEFVYNAALFDAATIRRWMRLYQRALETAAALPDTPLGELFTPTPDERRRLDEWNRSAADYPRDQTLLGPLLDQAHATPSAIAAVQGEATLTYERLDRRSAAVARALARRGVTRGAIVALCVERTLALFPAVLGILRAGAAHLPLDPSWPGDRLRLMIEDAGVAALVTESHLRARLGSSAPTLCLDADAVEIDDLEDPSLPLPPAPLPTDPAYVLYTSGSTGRPKGVVVGHRALHNLLASVRTSPGLAASDVVLAVTTISFDISTYDLFLPFMTGACVVLASRAEATDGQALARLIDRHGVTLMQATPATWQLLLAAGWNGRRGMRALSTGEALPPDLARRLLALDLELWNLYGPTETTVWCTLTRVEHVDGPIPIGRPVANTRLHVVDERLRLLPPGLPGEPLIGGDGLADGYLGRPDLTAEKFIPDPFTPGARLYRTGDLARWRDDGTLECMGRIDAQVKLRGYRIELGEIEAALRADPSVGEAAVALREDTPGNPRLAGYVVAAPGAAPDLAALRDRLRRSLPDYMVPSAIVILDALPLTPSGKLDRRRLPVPDPVLRPADEDALPRTHVEMLLAAIWADLLSLPRVRRDDNFFELGGHSLLAARVAARVREAFAVDLPLADCFEAPLLADLALRIEALMAAGPGAAADALPLLPVARDGVLPLSFAQQRLWFLDQMEPENAAYLVAFGLRIEGPVDAEALERALAALVERHEPLRTGFRMRRGQPVQVIADGRGFRLDRAAIEGDAEARRIAADFARRPFELDRPPLFRALLLTLAAKESLLVLAVHHIAADGWSLGLIVGELLQLYTAFRDGNAVDLPPLAIQYADYAHWQRERLQGEFLERELVWWRTRLAPPLPVLELPADRPRPAIQTFSGDRFDFIVDPALAVSVNTLARRHNASLFMALLAGFNALLHRWSGQADLIVGTPVAGRVRRDLEPLVGLFVNTLALRADLAGDPSFLALLARVREATLGALTHQEVPFERLVQELQPGRDLARNPVFQVMFALQNLPAARAAAAGLRVRPVAIENRTAKFDLSLTMMEAGDRLIGQFEYNADLFERGTIERLSAAFLRLLAAAVAEPGRPVGELPLLDDAERRRVIDDWNDTAVAIEEPAMAHFAISETAARQPDAVAVAQEGLLLTYGELEARANRLAHHLRARGVVAGDLVGVLMERTPALLPALLGIWKAGAAYLPLDPAYPPARIAYMVADSGARILLTNDRGKELPDAFDRVSFIPLDETFSSLAAEPATSPDIPPDPSRPAYVIYTSGSTGQPKGVVIPHRALVNFLSSVRRAPGLDAGDRLLAVTTLSFDISTLELFLPLRIGARIELSDRATAADGDALASLIDHAGITALQATPATWRLLIEAGWQGRPGFKALCGGEPMGRDLARALLDRGCELWNLYGPTETTVWSTVHRVTTADLAAAIPIGRPIDNTRCYVVDGRGRPVPVGVPGELWIGGAGVATGYLGRPELTAERFLPDPFFPGGRVYRTGDLARWREDGTLDCLGRLDHQVKLRGFRIELGEIEAALVTHPAVEQAVVMVREDTPGDPRLVAWFVPPAGATPDLADMRRHLRERLPFYMIPAVWTPLTALPLTPNGKVDRRALPAPERARGGGASAAPQRPMERILAAVWQSVLGVEAVGLHDNFFDLGGDSLRTVQVVARMHEESGIRLNPREFMLQTLGQVAALYERAAAAPSPAGEVIR